MPKIALFQNHPECSMQCCDGMIKALSPGYDIDLFVKEDVREGAFDSYDIIAFPGGIGDADTYYNFFKRRQGNAVADFIDRGGRYLGICMGAYWAGSDFFDILDNVVPVQYIKRDTADIRRPYGTVANIQWQGQPKNMFFYDGCALVGDESKFDTVARYANNDPMAIIQGRIGLIGCHPESENFWYKKQYNYINKHWHKGEHHKLLLEFANKLMEN